MKSIYKFLSLNSLISKTLHWTDLREKVRPEIKQLVELDCFQISCLNTQDFMLTGNHEEKTTLTSLLFLKSKEKLTSGQLFLYSEHLLCILVSHFYRNSLGEIIKIMNSDIFLWTMEWETIFIFVWKCRSMKIVPRDEKSGQVISCPKV